MFNMKNSRKNVRNITASAVAALALTFGAATTATAEPAENATETRDCFPVVPTPKVNEGIDWAKQQGYINPDEEWVPDYEAPYIARHCGDVYGQVIVPAGATGASPQAVLLFGDGEGEYVTTATPPIGFDADRQWGSRIGVSVADARVTDRSDVTIDWRNHDGEVATVTYRHHPGPDGGYFEVIRHLTINTG